MRMPEPDLRRFLDRDDTFAGIDRPAERVRAGGLACARRARDDDVPTGVNHRVEEHNGCLAEPEVGKRYDVYGEPTDRHARAVRREWWEHRVESRPVGEAGV